MHKAVISFGLAALTSACLCFRQLLPVSINL